MHWRQVTRRRSTRNGWTHWLIVAGAILLMLGFVGLALRQRGVEAELKEASDPSEPEAELAETQGADRNAKLEEQREKGTVGR